jgi:hypothetical protein
MSSTSICSQINGHWTILAPCAFFPIFLFRAGFIGLNINVITHLLSSHFENRYRYWANRVELLFLFSDIFLPDPSLMIPQRYLYDYSAILFRSLNNNFPTSVTAIPLLPSYCVCASKVNYYIQCPSCTVNLHTWTVTYKSCIRVLTYIWAPPQTANMGLFL